MPYQNCPHCGANRTNMPDSQKCWRCGRLPTTAVADVAPAYAAPPPRPQPIQQPPPIVYERPYIPLWLGITGSLGLALMVLLFVGGITLLLTADETEPTDEDSLSVLNEGTTVATALPTNTLPSAITPNPTVNSVENADTDSNNSMVLDPFSATSTAMITDGGPTPLPRPTERPTDTPAPTTTPTPIVCPGVVLPRLQIGGLAEVVISNTLRVRDAASINGTLVLNLARGETVTITGAPVCADGFLWWPIQIADGSAGWAAEGDGTQYFLEPR